MPEKGWLSGVLDRKMIVLCWNFMSRQLKEKTYFAFMIKTELLQMDGGHLPGKTSVRLSSSPLLRQATFPSTLFLTPHCCRNSNRLNCQTARPLGQAGLL